MMRVDDLIKLCKKLAPSQGFYGRLLRRLEEADEITLADLDSTMQSLNLKDEMDIIMWLEG